MSHCGEVRMPPTCPCSWRSVRAHLGGRWASTEQEEGGDSTARGSSRGGLWGAGQEASTGRAGRLSGCVYGVAHADSQGADSAGGEGPWLLAQDHRAQCQRSALRGLALSGKDRCRIEGCPLL